MPVMTAPALSLTAAQRAELTRMAASSSLPHRQVVQAKALLWAESEAADVTLAASHGDQVSVELLQRSATLVGEALAGLVNFFNPAVILIGRGRGRGRRLVPGHRASGRVQPIAAARHPFPAAHPVTDRPAGRPEGGGVHGGRRAAVAARTEQLDRARVTQGSPPALRLRMCPEPAGFSRPGRSPRTPAGRRRRPRTSRGSRAPCRRTAA